MDDPIEIRRIAESKGYRVRQLETLQLNPQTGKRTDHWFCLEKGNSLENYRPFPFTPDGLERALCWIEER